MIEFAVLATAFLASAVIIALLLFRLGTGREDRETLRTLPTTRMGAAGRRVTGLYVRRADEAAEREMEESR